MKNRIKIQLLGWAIGLGVLGFVAAMAQAGSLEPSAAPAPTMKTLDEIPPTWDQILPASARFVLVMGSNAVLDKETGLVWEKFLDTSTTRDWLTASVFCLQRTVGDRKGWRLPTIQELASLVDPTQSNPALPSGHPFLNVQPARYWSTTTLANDTSSAWHVIFSNGSVTDGPKASTFFVWCVRGGQGVDPQ